MLACARRAAVVLITCAAAVAVVAPAVDAEPHNVDFRPVAVVRTSAVTGTSLSLAPRHHTIKYAHRVQLTTRLTDKFGPLRHAKVTVWQRRPGRAWHRLRTLTTNSNGRSGQRMRLHRTTQFQTRYSGDLLHDSARSDVTTIRVLPPPPPSIAFGRRVVQEAAKHKGAPYAYGASGPNSFDCSGFTMYVFGKFGVSLPHNAASQYDVVHHVAQSRKQVGDLIFFTSSGGIYHVGIYAGHGEMWAATHTGDYVRLESIYSASYLVGRVTHHS